MGLDLAVYAKPVVVSWSCHSCCNCFVALRENTLVCCLREIPGGDTFQTCGLALRLQVPPARLSGCPKTLHPMLGHRCLYHEYLFPGIRFLVVFSTILHSPSHTSSNALTLSLVHICQWQSPVGFMSSEHLCHKLFPKLWGFYIVDDLIAVTVLPTHVVHASVPLLDFLKFRKKEVIPWKHAGVYLLKITSCNVLIIVLGSPVDRSSFYCSYRNKT